MSQSHIWFERTEAADRSRVAQRLVCVCVYMHMHVCVCVCGCAFVGVGVGVGVGVQMNNSSYITIQSLQFPV